MTDDKHFLYNCCGKSRREREELVLGEVGGDPISLYKPTSKDEENDSWVRKDQLQVAGGGGLLAWPLARVKRGSIWLDTFDQDKAYRVLIFDLRRHQLLAQTPWVPAPKAQFDYALSPDGEHIAILTDQWVAMYRIPPLDALASTMRRLHELRRRSDVTVRLSTSAEP